MRAALLLPLLAAGCSAVVPGPTWSGEGPPLEDPAARASERGDAEWPQYGRTSSNLSSSDARVPDAPALLFDYEIDGWLAYATPIVGDGRLYQRLYSDGMVALHAGTGALLWRATGLGATVGKYGTGAFDGGRVFTIGERPGGGAALVALDAASGAVLWHGAAGSAPIGALKVHRGTARTLLIFTATWQSLSGPVQALDAADGSVAWTSALPCTSDPAIDGGRVYCAGEDAVRAFDVETGATLFSVSAPGGAGLSSPAVAGGLLFYVGEQLHAFDATNGAVAWTAPFDRADRVKNGGTLVETGVAYAGGRLFVVGRGEVAAFAAATGERLWSTPVPAPGTTAVFSDGRLLVGGRVLLDAYTGAKVWETDRAFAASTPAVTDGHFYAAPEGTHIYGWGGAVPGPAPVY